MEFEPFSSLFRGFRGGFGGFPVRNLHFRHASQGCERSGAGQHARRRAAEEQPGGLAGAEHLAMRICHVVYHQLHYMHASYTYMTM